MPASESRPVEVIVMARISHVLHGGEVTAGDVELMQEKLLFDRHPKRDRYVRFFVMLLLSAVIATYGVVSDSVASVIGAMIVAPLMTPIMAVSLSVVSGDHRNIVRSLLIASSPRLANAPAKWISGSRWFRSAPWRDAAASEAAATARTRACGACKSRIRVPGRGRFPPGFLPGVRAEAPVPGHWRYCATRASPSGSTCAGPSAAISTFLIPPVKAKGGRYSGHTAEVESEPTSSPSTMA